MEAHPCPSSSSYCRLAVVQGVVVITDAHLRFIQAQGSCKDIIQEDKYIYTHTESCTFVSINDDWCKNTIIFQSYFIVSVMCLFFVASVLKHSVALWTWCWEMWSNKGQITALLGRWVPPLVVPASIKHIIIIGVYDKLISFFMGMSTDPDLLRVSPDLSKSTSVGRGAWSDRKPPFRIYFS